MPTVAIEHVYVWDNTSVIVDEVLAHRIGLVPLNVNPSLVETREGPEAHKLEFLPHMLETEERLHGRAIVAHLVQPQL